MRFDLDRDSVHKLSALDLRDAAWSPALGSASKDSRPRQGVTVGSQQIISLANDVLLVRTNYESVESARWELDMRGWLYLHYRLEG